jgi:sensor histidine kinase YesM
VTGHLFNFLIFCLIILNTLLLASDGHPTSPEKQEFMWYASEFFTWIFVAELLFKLIGLGPKNYIADSYNIFDAVVVGISLVDWVIE